MSNEEFFTNGLESRVSRHKKNQKKKRYILIISFIFLLAICIAIIPFLFNDKPVFSKSVERISHVGSKMEDRYEFTKLLAHKENKKQHTDLKTKEPLKGSQKEMEETDKNTNIEVTEEVVHEQSSKMSIQPKQVIQHKVKPNETLFDITMIYYNNGNAQETVAQFNGITNPEKEVQTGKILKIPDPHYMVYHQVKRGDTLQRISQQYYGTTEYMGALAIHNGLSNVNHVPNGISLHIPNPKKLQRGVAVSIEKEMVESESQEKVQVRGEFRIEVNKKENELYVFRGDQLVKIFSVGTGREASMTPVGEFTIVNKLEKPWYSGKGIPGGSPDNPLGSHWLGLSVPGTNGTLYGLHGTNDPTSIGKYVSLGCIRMHNSDVQWLYDMVPIGTVVHIY